MDGGSFKLNIDTSEFIVELDNFSKDLQSALTDSVSLVAEATYNELANRVKSANISNSLKDVYLNSLNVHKVEKNSYIIEIQGNEAERVEAGSPAYNMRDVLLNSKKLVSSGSRAGRPWVRTSKKGNKYAAVPFAHKISAKGVTDLASAIKKLEATSRQGIKQRISKIYRDVNSGEPLQGKVASVTNTNIQNLMGLTKYQYKVGKQIKSFYFTFRTISDGVSSGWMHRGTGGVHAFRDIESFIESQFEEIIKAFGD